LGLVDAWATMLCCAMLCGLLGFLVFLVAGVFIGFNTQHVSFRKLACTYPYEGTSEQTVNMITTCNRMYDVSDPMRSVLVKPE
jgi:hypothetical protein